MQIIAKRGRDSLSREARASGLRVDVSMDAVDRRRLQVWGLALGILVAVTAALVVIPYATPLGAGTPPSVLRVALLFLALAFSAIAVEKEIHLRRVSRLLLDERVRNRALAEQLLERSTLLTVGKAVNNALDLEEVLGIILSSAVELLGGKEGAILLSEPDGLRPVAATEQGHVSAKAQAERVAATLAPVVVPGSEGVGDGTMLVPLMNRDRFLGVLCVEALPEQPFGDEDLSLLTVFAEHAAISIANAHLYESERRRANDLLEVYRLKSDFVAALAHELSAPLGSILAEATALQSEDLAGKERIWAIDSIARQAGRLHRMVEGVSNGESSGGEAGQPGPVDVGALVHDVAGMFSRAGRPVAATAPDRCVALGDEDILSRVFVSLVEGRFGVGHPPVNVVAEARGHEVLVSVTDEGKPPPEADLAIPQAVVAALGGRLWVDRGQTSAIRIALPAA